MVLVVIASIMTIYEEIDRQTDSQRDTDEWTDRQIVYC